MRHQNDEEKEKETKKKKNVSLLYITFLFKVNIGNSAVKNLNPNAQQFSSFDYNQGTVLAGSAAPSGKFLLSCDAKYCL